MDLDDRISIATPEGLELELQLAGLGSRFIAGVLDLIFEGILILIVSVAVGTSGLHGNPRLGVLGIALTALPLLYNVAFELGARGRTPGKALVHLRVVRDQGTPVDAPASAIRNVMRLIDGATLLYLPTIFAVALSRLNQRPGDMAAGTIVIRQQRVSRRDVAGSTPSAGGTGWDASAISQEEVAAVRTFLERREKLDLGTRRQLATQLASSLRPRVSGAPVSLAAEQFLELLVGAKAGHR